MLCKIAISYTESSPSVSTIGIINIQHCTCKHAKYSTLHIYVCIYVHTYVWMFMYMQIYMYVCKCIYTCTYMCVQVYIYMWIYVCINVYIHTNMYVCVCLFLCVCMCVYNPSMGDNWKYLCFCLSIVYGYAWKHLQMNSVFQSIYWLKGFAIPIRDWNHLTNRWAE